MTEPGSLRDGHRIAYGLGLFLSNFEGRPEIFHGGGIVGFTGYLGVYPADNLIVVTLTNSDAAHLYDGHLARAILDGVRGTGARQPFSVDSDPAVLDQFVGTYRMGSASIIVRRNGSVITLDNENTVEHLWERDFAHRGGTSFSSVNNAEFRIDFSPDARQLAITLSGRAFGSATRSR